MVKGVKVLLMALLELQVQLGLMEMLKIEMDVVELLAQKMELQ